MLARGSAVILLLLLAAGVHASPATQPESVPLDAIGKATPITLKLDNVSPKIAFDKLEQAANVHLMTAQPDMLTRLDDHPITANFNKTPYLDAMLELCRQAGVQVNFIGSRLMLLPSPDHRSIPPYTIAGPLAIFCNGAVFNREIHFGATPTASASVLLNLSLISEPSAPIIGVDRPVADVHAIDGRNQPVAALDLPNVPAFRARMDGMSENRFFALQLAMDPAAGDTLKTVGGTAFVWTITKTDTLNINDIAGAEGTTATIGDSEITVTHVEEQPGGQCLVSIDVKSISLTPVFFTRMRFADAQFAPRVEGGGSVQIRTAQSKDNVQSLILQINRTQPTDVGDKKPLNLVWLLPSEIRRVAVPFEFHDLKVR